MLRLLGILSLGDLLFGGHRRHRALRRGLLWGVLLGYLADKDFDADRVAVDRAAREAVKAAKREIRRAEHDQRAAEIRERMDARKAEREERLETVRAEIKARKEETRQEKTEVRALPVSGVNEAKEIRELADELDRDARTAAMAANVPTIDFPEEDEKDYSARKYGVVQ